MNLIAAYSWYVRWLEVYGMMVSVKVDFLYMAALKFVGVRCMVMSG